VSATYDPAWIRDHYDVYGDREWTRWEESPVERVKFLVHREILREFVQAGDRVLEIGAGAGRFTREMAALGCRVVVTDISRVQLQLNRLHATSDDFVGAVESWIECDVCELDRQVDGGAFDVVVCYGGPLSYALDRRADALRQMARAVRPGGRVLLGVMSLWGTAHQYLAGVLRVDVDANRELLASGDLLPERVGSGVQRCHMFRVDELRDLVESVGLTIECLSASDCLSVGWAEQLSTLGEESEAWRHLLEMEIEACREPGCAGMGSHIIAVARR